MRHTAPHGRSPTTPVAPSDVGDASMPDYATLRDAGDRRRSADGSKYVRRPGRRPVLPRPARVRPAVRRRPHRGRQRHPRRATTSTRSRCRCRRRSWPRAATTTSTRSSASGSHRPQRTERPSGSQYGPGLAAGHARWSTRSSSRARTRTSSTRPSRGTTASSCRTSTDPELPQLIEAIYGIHAPGDPAQRPGRACSSPGQRAQQAAERAAERAAPAQHVDRALHHADADGSASSAATTRASRTAAGSTDDVIDIALQVVEGELRRLRTPDLGDGVDANDKTFEQLLPVPGPAARRVLIVGVVHTLGSGARSAPLPTHLEGVHG